MDVERLSIEVNLLKDGVYELDEVYAIYPDYVIEAMTEEQRANIPHEFKTSLFPDLTIAVRDVFKGRF